MSLVRVADGVLVGTSRRLRTTTTLALGPRRAGRRAGLLVDPAWEPDELESLAAACDERGIGVAAGFSTHAHHDHLLWHPALGRDVPRWATSAAARTARDARAVLLAEAAQDSSRYGGAEHPPEVLELLGAVRPLAAGATRIPDPDGALPELELVEHDGHAPGHAAVWLPRSGVLLAGDMLSDAELPLPHDEVTGACDVDSYRAGLDRLAPVVARADVVVPGHGTPSSWPSARLEADRRYLDDVTAGRAVHDPRLGLPGAAGPHARLVAAVRRREA
ncbi:MBL fold metallo-hydrolase [Isoptericola aurantiacus]|uniref:MBL fold metallo-hydrolase n=1 Tax=Isoptericola aurantiacus TaxID=3377839 RepID=UPI003839EBCC